MRIDTTPFYKDFYVDKITQSDDKIYSYTEELTIGFLETVDISENFGQVDD